MRVGFDTGGITERGTAVAMFDYARYARALLGVDPVIFYDTRYTANPAHVMRFSEQFPTFAYGTEEEMQRAMERQKLDLVYFLKLVRQDRRLSASCRSVVHMVFQVFAPHGSTYAYVSEWLADTMTGGRYPHVPHIVDLPSARENPRSRLGIPADAFVVGRHGGRDELNVPFVPAALLQALERRKNLWILLMNTNLAVSHERIVHLPGTSDRQAVSDFIEACDAGLNGRLIGETFGLAIAEFLARDKPVFVWAGGNDRNHLKLVRDPGFRYRTAAELVRLLTETEARDWNGTWLQSVAPFSPRAVMDTFAEVFLAERAQDVAPSPPPLGWQTRRRIELRLNRAQQHLWFAGLPV